MQFTAYIHIHSVCIYIYTYKLQFVNFKSARAILCWMSTCSEASSIDTAEFEWGSIGGDIHNAGRYCVVGLLLMSLHTVQSLWSRY